MKKLPVYHIEDFQFYAHSFYANDLASHIREHGFIEQSHRHNFYLSVLFTSGSGTHEIDFTSYKVRKGSLFLMKPGQSHRWNLSRNTKGYILFHTAEFYDTIFSGKRITDYPFFSPVHHSPVMYPNKTAQPFIESLFSKILETYRTNIPSLKFQTILALTDLLYLELSRIYLPGQLLQTHSPLYLEKLNELQQLIDEHYRVAKYPMQYADMMSISPKHLNRICKEVTGKTTSEIIVDRIILEAKRMLAQHGKSVNDIAAYLGFNDTSYFIRLFKKHAGEVPSAFIKKHR